MGDAISTATVIKCDCCQQRKLCKMYVIQTGDTAWVCVDCRKGQTTNVRS